ncbi:chymotrypsin inhibitor Ani s 6-like [Armigeres subalbatus]|uniref:chymotrypsin inhibitor Ani s 6-like n=1 Tax=Armigeres subalbatus TaxID=124917 RepID=UPI002ED569F8
MIMKLIILVALIAGISYSTAHPRCDDPHEEYKVCGTACQVHCSILGLKMLYKCPAVCVEGCFCREGYVRQFENGKGPCIREDECPCPPEPTTTECPPGHEGH